MAPGVWQEWVFLGVGQEVQTLSPCPWLVGLGVAFKTLAIQLDSLLLPPTLKMVLPVLLPHPHASENSSNLGGFNLLGPA